MTNPFQSSIFYLFVAIALSVPLSVKKAGAQNEFELINLFSGDWAVFDPRFSTDENPCRLSLGKDLVAETPTTSRTTQVAANCKAPLSGTVIWRISDGVILLETQDGSEISELGGDPQRLTGGFSGSPDAVVLERNDGSGAKASLVAAIARHKCYYLGYQSVCADADSTKAPELTDGEAEISVQVTLNVRSQPRRGAPLIGTIPTGSDVTVNLCLATSDGIWCRAEFGEQSGWMAKSAVRQQEWPVITFVNAKE